jgi:hypothetical protein
MRFDVPMLPHPDCMLVGSKRREKAWNEAKDALAAEVYHSAPTGHEPFERPHIVITAFVGDGHPVYYRPQSPFYLWPALDGVFEGLRRANLIKSPGAVPIITTTVMTDCGDVEGLQITIEELS